MISSPFPRDCVGSKWGFTDNFSAFGFVGMVTFQRQGSNVKLCLRINIILSTLELAESTRPFTFQSYRMCSSRKKWNLLIKGWKKRQTSIRWVQLWSVHLMGGKNNSCNGIIPRMSSLATHTSLPLGLYESAFPQTLNAKARRTKTWKVFSWGFWQKTDPLSAPWRQVRDWQHH